MELGRIFFLRISYFCGVLGNRSMEIRRYPFCLSSFAHRQEKLLDQITQYAVKRRFAMGAKRPPRSYDRYPLRHCTMTNAVMGEKGLGVCDLGARSLPHDTETRRAPMYSTDR